MPEKDNSEKLLQMFQEIKSLAQAARRLRDLLKKHEGVRKIKHTELTLGSGEYPCTAEQVIVVGETGHKKSATELRTISPGEFKTLVKRAENKLVVKKLAWRAKRLFKFFAPPRKKVLDEIKESGAYARTKFPERLYVVPKKMLTAEHGVLVDPWNLYLRPLEKLNLLRRFMQINDQISNPSWSNFASEFNMHSIDRGDCMRIINIKVTDTHVEKLGVKDPCHCLGRCSFYMLDYAQLEKEIKRLDEYFGLMPERKSEPNLNSTGKNQNWGR